jgi:hypothetical protein
METTARNFYQRSCLLIAGEGLQNVCWRLQRRNGNFESLSVATRIRLGFLKLAFTCMFLRRQIADILFCLDLASWVCDIHTLLVLSGAGV